MTVEVLCWCWFWRGCWWYCYAVAGGGVYWGKGRAEKEE